MNPGQFLPADRAFHSHAQPNLNPPYPTDPAGRPYVYFYPPYLQYDPEAPLRANPYARLPPRPQWPRGNPPPPPLTTFAQQQIALSRPAARPPIQHLFDNIPAPHLHYRLRRLCRALDKFISALPYVLAGVLIYPSYWFFVVPPRFIVTKLVEIQWEVLWTAIQDLGWVIKVVDRFLERLVLKLLVFLILKPLHTARVFLRERLRMRSVWCMVFAFAFVKTFLDRPLEVEWSRDERDLRYILVPEAKRWAVGKVQIVSLDWYRSQRVEALIALQL